MNIDQLTGDQAEEILVSLALRHQQKGLSWASKQRVEEIGDYLSPIFREHFGWDTENVFRAHLSTPRTVTVR